MSTTQRLDRSPEASNTWGRNGGLAGLVALQPFWITFLACLLILILRDLPSFLAPPIMVEDATEMLSVYYHNSDPAAIFRFYAGYISLGPNIVGYISGWVPLTLAPYVLYWTPVAMTAATFAVTQIRGVELLGLGVMDKFLIALLLCAIPFANWSVVSNTTYMLWNALIFSTVLVLFWTPKPGFAAGLLMALLLCFSWTHPLFVLLVPALLIRIVIAQNRFQRIGFGLIIMSVLAYMALGIDVDGRPQELTLGPLQILSDSLRLFFARGVFEPFFSTRLRFFLATHGLLSVVIALGVMLCAAFALFVAMRWHQTGRQQNVQILVLLLFAVLFTVASAAGGKTLLFSVYGERYTYPTAYLVLLLSGWGLAVLARNQSPKRRAAGLALIVLFLLVRNGLDLRLYRIDPAIGAETATFIAAVETRAAEGTPYCARLERGPWSIVLSEGWPAEQECPIIAPDR